jgi:hypothetical protein
MLTRTHNLKYDSILEQKFHEQFSDLIYHENNFNHYPLTFYDAEAVGYKATPDFYCDQRNIVIELKGHQLNNTKSKLLSNSKLQNQQSFRGSLTTFDHLRYGWNHSRYKQGTVNRCIRSSNYQYQFLLVFTNDTKLSTQAKNSMAKEKIDWCFASEWQGYTFNKY